MTETRVGFLFKAASLLLAVPSNPRKILNSYYLSKCKEITKGYGLPQKQFSKKSRCPLCFIEWSSNCVSKVLPLKLSKKQRKRLRKKNKKRNNLIKGDEIINAIKLLRTCSFCGHETTLIISKPNKDNINNINQIEDSILKIPKKNIVYKKFENSKIKQTLEKNVYCRFNEAFSLKSNKNTLQSTIKEPKKIIKNNKKKKDKFAGLCQKAVLSATKMKIEKDKKNPINLFLKPSQ